MNAGQDWGQRIRRLWPDRADMQEALASGAYDEARKEWFIERGARFHAGHYKKNTFSVWAPWIAGSGNFHLAGKGNRLRLFRSIDAAQKVADQLNELSKAAA